MDIQKDSWIWAIVQDPGGNEMFLGQHDQVKDISYVPAFLEKGEAEACLAMLKKDENLEYEVQAIQYGLLMQYCTDNGFMIFICNEKGEVLQRIDL